MHIRTCLTLAAAALFTWTGNSADAAVFRVNNTAGSDPHYSDLSQAVNAAAAGDTLYVEGSATDYGYTVVNKRLTLIGSGYFLNETTPNPRTQANPSSSTVSTIILNRGSKGCVIQGFTIGSIVINDSAITVQRNHISSAVSLGSGNAVANDTLRNNYLTTYLQANYPSNAVTGLMIYNNIFTYHYVIDVSTTNINRCAGYFINNTFPAGANTFQCVGFVFQNNIFGSSQDFRGYQSSNSFFNNVAASTNGIPAGNGNVLGASAALMFLPATTPASTDGRFQLQSGSPAAGAGTMNGSPVDCGAFGGPAPYILSGMPPIPSVYSLSVPAQVVQGATSINVSFSTAAH